MYNYFHGLASRIRFFPLRERTAIEKGRITRPTLQCLLQEFAPLITRLSDPDVTPLIGKALAVKNNLTFGDTELNLARNVHVIYVVFLWSVSLTWSIFLPASRLPWLTRKGTKPRAHRVRKIT